MSAQTKAIFLGGTLDFYDGTTFERTGRFAPLAFIDDFIGADVAFPAAGAPESGCAWVVKVVDTAGTAAAAGDADAVGGTVSLALDNTDEKQEASLYMNDELQFSIAQGLIFEARITPAVLPTLGAELVVGLISAWADGLDAATYSAFFTMDGSGEIFCEADDNATDRSTTSGVTLTAGAYAVLRLDCTDVADLKFYVNGNRVASATTFAWAASAANSKVQPIASAYKASSAGVGTLTVDRIACWQNRS